MHEHDTRDDAISALQKTADALRDENAKLYGIVRAATDYYYAVKSANDTMRVNARRGGSSSAYEAVNRTRLRAKEKHETLMQVIEARETGAEYQEPEPAPIGERPEDI